MSLKKTFGWATVGAVAGAAAFPILGVVTGQPVEGTAGLNAGMAAFGALMCGLMAVEEAPASAPPPEPR